MAKYIDAEIRKGNSIPQYTPDQESLAEEYIDDHKRWPAAVAIDPIRDVVTNALAADVVHSEKVKAWLDLLEAAIESINAPPDE
jgi:hypothetical protein